MTIVTSTDSVQSTASDPDPERAVEPVTVFPRAITWLAGSAAR